MAQSDQISQYNIGFIGPGNMCKAIVGGLRARDFFKPSQIFLHGRDIEKIKKTQEFIGCNIVEFEKLIEYCNVIFLCVKPFVCDTILIQINNLENLLSSKYKDKIIVSILAGVTISRIKTRLPALLFEKYGWKIIRVMPNTPLMVQQGAVVYSIDDPNWDSVAALLMQMLFGGCSGVCKNIPEHQINAAGAVSGSGPAYTYIMIEALSDGGVKMGLPRDLATQLAAQTLLGAAKMVLETGKHPGLLKDEVCSPKGTTIAGVKALEDGKIRHTLMNAVEAACQRSEELGKDQ